MSIQKSKSEDFSRLKDLVLVIDTNETESAQFKASLLALKGITSIGVQNEESQDRPLSQSTTISPSPETPQSSVSPSDASDQSGLSLADKVRLCYRLVMECGVDSRFNLKHRLYHETDSKFWVPFVVPVTVAVLLIIGLMCTPESVKSCMSLLVAMMFREMAVYPFFIIYRITQLRERVPCFSGYYEGNEAILGLTSFSIFMLLMFFWAIAQSPETWELLLTLMFEVHFRI